ncbi:putative disease resistance protein [Forsythia ovata]|uniref:Disease resistance protein n=1 Tax=Forsythia ovata TaxID=205694 RepID=A0ABD1V1K6_9LAMI
MAVELFQALTNKEKFVLILDDVSKQIDTENIEVKEICKKMTKRCSGLSLALVTLAGSMMGMTDIHEWRDASEELDESCMGQADMENGILPILVYAFNRLKDPKLKSFFLYCSLYPED